MTRRPRDLLYPPRRSTPGAPPAASSAPLADHSQFALPTVDAPAAPRTDDPSWDQQTKQRRERQICVGKILDDIFGKPGECRPDLWERKTYLLLVGMVYERLARDEKNLPTDELIALAKVLAESRRAQLKSRPDDAHDPGSNVPQADTAALPEHLARTVREVYGTGLPPQDAEQQTQSKPEINPDP